LFTGEDALKGSLIMTRSAKIRSVTDKEYIVAAHSGTIMEMIEKNKMEIEGLLEKRTGARRAVKCVFEEPKNGGAREKTIEEIAARAESALGISIEIVD
jgi:hypothetical protein